MRILAALIPLLLFLAGPALAEPQDFPEKLDIGISTDEIAITSDFRGADLTIFGAIDGFNANLLDLPIQNAVTSRVKTLIPMKSVAHLQALTTDMALTEKCCERIASTGLYPYAVADQAERRFEARQFPKSSGYPEDAATGIAAAALAFGLLKNGLVARDSGRITILQGRAMNALSEIRVRIGFADGRPVGCLLGGEVMPADEHAA